MDNENKLQNISKERLSCFVIALYVWIIAIFFGAVLLDVAYSNSLSKVLGASETATVFSEISDILLRIGFITVLAALGAIGVSWESRIARNFFIASLFILFGEFLGPVFLSEAMVNTGSWLRIIVNGTASILALIGLYKFCRPR